MDAISKFEEERQMHVLFDVLQKLGLDHELAILRFGAWGVEFEAKTPLIESEIKLLATRLSGNSTWPDLSYSLPIAEKFTLKVC